MIREHIVESLVRIYATTALQERSSLGEHVQLTVLEQPTDDEIAEAKRRFGELRPDQWTEAAEREARPPTPRPALRIVRDDDDRP